MWWIIAGLVVAVISGIIWGTRSRLRVNGVRVNPPTRLQRNCDYFMCLLSGAFIGYGLCIVFDLSFVWLPFLILGSLVSLSVLISYTRCVITGKSVKICLGKKDK